ncbi:MAG: xylann 1,4-beta-xylosidase [Eubacterium sp.]|nr:xylann 1,4-beta-xylosidase [Eubacterium sp.]
MINNKYYNKCITFGRAAEGLRADFQEQLKELQSEIGFEYIRFHGLFHDDMAVYDEDENGNPVLWFGYIDKLFDFLLSVNIKPFVELGFMPIKIATVPNTVFWWQANGCPPTDYDKWHYLVNETVKHLTERYGIDEVKSWYFEVWNEPNLGSFFKGTQEEYFKLYEVSVDAVKSVCSDYRVGGPSTSGADFREGLGYLKAFIDFCDSKKLPVDFFSAHPYPTCWALDEEGTEHMGYISKEICIEFLDNIKSIVDDSPYPNAEIHLTEWNSSPSPRDLIHDTPFMAPFILYNITQNFGKINSLGFWTFTDIFEENGPGKSPFHGGFGLINADGIKKPAYWAYWLLNKLGNEIVEQSDNYIITKSGNDYQIIIWNYCYYKDNFANGDRSELTETSRDYVFQNKDITVDLSIDLNGEYEQTIYTLDESTSALHNWINMDAPQYPTVNQIKELKAISKPKAETSKINLFDISETLKPHEVKMFVLEKMSNDNA